MAWTHHNPLAFPLPIGTMNSAEPSESGGMQLRDYFAAAAITGILSSLDPRNENLTPAQARKMCASAAFAIADEMLAMRSQSVMDDAPTPTTNEGEPSDATSI